jgi:hypothetical protein
MAKLPDLIVSAVTTFDGKALAKGEKQIGGLDKTAKKLGKALVAAFSVQQVLAFGKASIKAFAEDEAAAARLTKTVNNLGLGFENTRITKFIADLEKTANVSDDVLRPAFSSLLTTTGSVEQSQKLLALALDVAAGSGEDVASVAGDLSAAYTGNTKGLAKYRLGLTKAELAGKGFNEIQELLNDQFSGQNSARLDTYEGKVAALTISFGNMQEAVGEGLVNAFSILAGDGGIDGATQAMEDFGETAALVLAGTASYIDKLIKLISGDGGGGGPKLGNFSALLLPLLGKGGILDITKGEGIKVTTPTGTAKGDKAIEAEAAAAAKARAKAEADAAKRQKELLALQKKSAITEKNKLSLSKAAAVFDSTRISIAAALQATYDKETRLRLEALMAIEEDNGTLALQKINELAALQKNSDMAKLAGIATINDATLSALNTQLLAELSSINTSKMAEADKEVARQAAFGKYNAAITAAGDLASKESYNERVQIQLTEIARLASLSKTSNALSTALLLRESEELNVIKRVSDAQKAADDARLAALQKYITALGSLGATVGDGGSGGIFGGGTTFGGTMTAATIAAAIAARAGHPISGPSDPRVLYGGMRPNMGGGYDYFNPDMAGMMTSGGGAPTVTKVELTVSAGVIATPDEFVLLVQNTIQDLNRGGDPLSVAGTL